ncbi:MAG: bifunctional riboflavin kinase/FMN adenylyltransferase, partial [Gemmatimonadetes bacterium]|nr:bifunctional riboflavin kinase/FMN adenylyltransferase [Gemmatimonadota bacterium]
LVIGPGTSIGHDAVGDSAALETLGRRGGFRVRIVEPVLHRGSPVRSSTIRAALQEGRVRDAAAMLGRPFALSGPVTSGNRRGRELGFPTANLALPRDTALPSNGVYAAWAAVGGVRHAAAASVGVRPTFGGGPQDERIVEAFLLDFQGDLYGQTMRLEFVERLRDEERFPSADALARQMSRDIEAASRALEQTAPARGRRRRE